MQVMNLQSQGDELRKAILDTLRQHGIDADKGDQVQVSRSGCPAGDLQDPRPARARVDQMQGGSALGAAGSSTEEDSISALERLQRLREQGVLSAEEFERQKTKILGG